ncbi:MULTISPECIES: acrylyl-CoA reductase family protein [Mycolicibacterium]|uniref:Alcohol dehydrogenase n=2 Tax=Mycolicibacterium TaxID=1866885 RepID=A0A0U1DV02_9MYCO|nr:MULTISPECIES: acryloyl-CoA reductase [Mycolicibacterium]QZH66021.1 acryloyl-CoA reductase [Mycolicibacterium farcinogenes]CQD23223.1 alcohol dehydrogenase [Mycolicibacterium conceptionense]
MEFEPSSDASQAGGQRDGDPAEAGTSPQVRALIADSEGAQTTLALRTVGADELGEGDVLIAVSWSSVNFKDALATRKDGKVARINPLIPGIDLAGEIVDPGSSGLDVGAPVVVHGYDLGVAHHGGYSTYARVPADWIVPLPAGLSLREAMTLGTAGFTAALSVITLQEHGLRPDEGPVVVTGATGGVGSVAVSILAAQGFTVTAVTGKTDATDWLHALGASVVVDRSGIGDPARPLQKETWAGAVDSVGGSTLAAVLASMRYGSAVAASGNTGGVALPTTVFPFILRGVSLLGIDSVQCPILRRRQVWERLAGDLRPPLLDKLATDEVGLAEVAAALARIRAGANRGRTLVRVDPTS